jgi:outer membrane receptor protein involved in Fe transport
MRRSVFILPLMVALGYAGRATGQEGGAPAATATATPAATAEPAPTPAEPDDEWSGRQTPSWTPESGAGHLRVSSATKAGAAERVPETAAQVTIVTAEELQAFGHRTLADIVENTPESFVGGERTYPILGLRGVARAGDFNTRVLLLLDGHVINEPWNNYAPGGTDLPLDFSQVERVEVLAGPVSALYGSNALFGAIQVVTREPTARSAGGALTAGSGSYGRGAAWYGDGGRGPIPWSLLVSGTGLHSEGESLRHDDLGTEKGTDWDRSGSLLVRATRGPIRVLAYGRARRHGTIAGAFGSRFDDDRSFTEDLHGLLDVSWTAVERERSALRLRAYGDAYRFADLYRYDPAPVLHDRASAMWGGVEAVVTHRTQRHRLIASLEDSAGEVTQNAFERGDSDTTAPDPDAPPNSIPADRRRFHLVRGTVHDAIAVRENVKLEAGLYAEYHDLYGFAVAPRAGVVAQAPAALTLKALYGRGFRSPSIYERYYDDGVAVAGNDELSAETADVFELGIEKTLGTGVDTFVSAFHGVYRDLMVLETRDVDPDPGVTDLRGQFVNAGLARSSGATVAFQLRRGGWIAWVDATAFEHEEDRDESTATQGAPEWVAHAMGIVPFGDRLTFAARASGVGSRTSREPGRHLAPYVVADLSMQVALTGGFSGRVSGANLLGAEALQPASEEYAPNELPGMGPRVFVELRWEQ